ncbi:MAG: DUF6062 family protein [Ruminococcus sp.]|nr:DUF6062 family protein [Ruminococcus sp.]
MRESILTIPVNEIFEPKCGCPICRMRDMLEQRTIEYIMGAAMMEPDVRMETNRLGFCKTHFEQMRDCKNRLSLALMLQSHLQDIQKNIFDRKSIFEGKTAKQRKVSQIHNNCFVCSKVEWGMSRLMVTFFEMFVKSADFRELFSEQEMLCMPHYDLLVSMSADSMDKKYQKKFIEACNRLVKKYLDELEQDVSHYCKMYDYRNSGKDADWGNSKDSIERSIKFLTTR